jgi:hypothetical protein
MRILHRRQERSAGSSNVVRVTQDSKCRTAVPASIVIVIPVVVPLGVSLTMLLPVPVPLPLLLVCAASDALNCTALRCTSLHFLSFCLVTSGVHSPLDGCEELPLLGGR